MIDLKLDGKVSVKDGFYMLTQKITKFFAHPISRWRVGRGSMRQGGGSVVTG